MPRRCRQSSALLKSTPATFGLLLFVATLSIIYRSTSLPPCQQPAAACPSSVELCAHQPAPPCECPTPPTPAEPWATSNYVVGPATDWHKDNLRNDTHYITAWANAGFTNQFMSYANMIYLGTISDRVPVVPPFAPDHHISPSAGPLPFGEIFDLTELRRSLHKPILEWSDIKALSPRLSTAPPAVVEQLGCWSTRSENEKEPILAQHLLRHLGLDVSYTRIPRHTRHRPEVDSNVHVAFFPLAEVLYPQSPSTKPYDHPLMKESPLGSTLSPGTHMSCLDYLYFGTVGTEEYEWTRPWSPVWRTIGRNLKFNEPLVRLTKAYLRRVFHVEGQLPPFISVHARRGDFAQQCFDLPVQGCLAPLSAYARRVREVQESLFLKRSLRVTEVLLTSDEKAPEFWHQVEDLGWRFIDHTAEQTLGRHGEWYLPLIDIVAQSLGAGFVGSQDSTVSIVSGRRVEEWNHGVTRMVMWGGLE